MDYMLPAEPTFLGLVPPRPVLKKIQFLGGFSKPQHHDLDAGFDNPHGFRWVVEMPPQMSTHGNSSGHFMDIFTRN